MTTFGGLVRKAFVLFLTIPALVLYGLFSLLDAILRAGQKIRGSGRLS